MFHAIVLGFGFVIGAGLGWFTLIFLAGVIRSFL
jgi:hypothetical protein